MRSEQLDPRLRGDDVGAFASGPGRRPVVSASDSAESGQARGRPGDGRTFPRTAVRLRGDDVGRLHHVRVGDASSSLGIRRAAAAPSVAYAGLMMSRTMRDCRMVDSTARPAEGPCWAHSDSFHLAACDRLRSKDRPAAGGSGSLLRPVVRRSGPLLLRARGPRGGGTSRRHGVRGVSLPAAGRRPGSRGGWPGHHRPRSPATAGAPWLRRSSRRAGCRR